MVEIYLKFLLLYVSKGSKFKTFYKLIEEFDIIVGFVQLFLFGKYY